MSRLVPLPRAARGLAVAAGLTLLTASCSSDDAEVVSDDGDVVVEDTATTSAVPTTTPGTAPTTSEPTEEAATVTAAPEALAETTVPATVYDSNGRLVLPAHDISEFPGGLFDDVVGLALVGDCVEIDLGFREPVPAVWPQGWTADVDSPVTVYDGPGTPAAADGQRVQMNGYFTEDPALVAAVPASCGASSVYVVGSVSASGT